MDSLKEKEQAFQLAPARGKCRCREDILFFLSPSILPPPPTKVMAKGSLPFDRKAGMSDHLVKVACFLEPSVRGPGLIAESFVE